MSRTVDELFIEAAELAERERAELADRLLLSLEPPADAELEDEWDEEIARRLAQFEAGEVEPLSWAEVKARVFGPANGA
jgi:putative addiction module component (TIGR02574 family)